jgi:uncharacterized protein (TIGR03435 family)
MRRGITIAVVLGACWLAVAQKSEAPAFEAASVKVSHATDGNSSTHGRPGNLSLSNVPLRQIIVRAFEVRDYQVSGPEWLRSERYDIVAKAPFGSPPEQLPAMLRTLLAERFKLETHREKRDLPVYGLVPMKSGFKLKPVTEKENNGTTSNDSHFKGTGVTLSRFAEWLSLRMDRPVLDMTGIEGTFSFELNFTRDETRLPTDAPPVPTLPYAIQEQMGLRLEKRTAPIDMLVVDHAEKVPIEN